MYSLVGRLAQISNAKSVNQRWKNFPLKNSLTSQQNTVSHFNFPSAATFCHQYNVTKLRITVGCHTHWTNKQLTTRRDATSRTLPARGARHTRACIHSVTARARHVLSPRRPGDTAAAPPAPARAPLPPRLRAPPQRSPSLPTFLHLHCCDIEIQFSIGNSPRGRPTYSNLAFASRFLRQLIAEIN